MRKLNFLILILAAFIVACGGGNGDDKQEPSKEEVAPVSSAAGDAVKGEELFNQTVIGSQPGCITCHSLEPGKVLVGPSLAGIAAWAGSRVSGQSAEEYLRESIVNANAFAVEGFAAGVMPAGLADELSDQQVADLVVFLLTLEQ